MKPLSDRDQALARSFAKGIINDTILAAIIHGFSPEDVTPESRAKKILSFCLNSVDMTTGMEGAPNAEAIREFMKAFLREQISTALHHRTDGIWQD